MRKTRREIVFEPEYDFRIAIREMVEVEKSN